MKTMKTALIGLAAAALLSPLPAAAADEKSAGDPVEVIRSAAEELEQGLDGRREELGQDRKALYAMISGILDPRFDRRYAASLVLGRAWRDASDEQRRRFIEAFYQTLLQRYADGVLEYSEDRVKILPSRGGGDRRTIVRTEVKLDDGSTVPVNYGLVKRSDGWKVYDVTVEGISYVRNFRTEINAEINATSLDAVIERLEKEAAAG